MKYFLNIYNRNDKNEFYQTTNIELDSTTWNDIIRLFLENNELGNSLITLKTDDLLIKVFTSHTQYFEFVVIFEDNNEE